MFQRLSKSKINLQKLQLLKNIGGQRYYDEHDIYTKRANRTKAFKMEKKFDYSISPSYHNLQFSKEKIIGNYGELPEGEIPEFLKYEREFKISSLSNGLRVCTESFPGAVTGVGVFIQAGSRNESPETSGTAHFIEHLHFKGTEQRTRMQIEQEMENSGCHLNAFTSREMTCYHIQLLPQNLQKAVSLLGDIMQNSLYNKNQLEAERETILHELSEVGRDNLEVLMENVYGNIYKDHMMGFPILGEKDKISNITVEMVKEFHSRFYIAPRMVLVGTGNISHEELCEMGEEHFGGVPTGIPQGLLEYVHLPSIYNPGMTLIRDDELVNTNVGVFFNAPGWGHEDYYTFLLIERLLGEYTVERDAEHLTDVRMQYNSMRQLLGELPDVTRQLAIYSPYSDSGIFGNYFFGNEIFTKQMNYVGLMLPPSLGDSLNEVEVYRAKNLLYNDLSSIESCGDIMQSIGQQILFMNRRIPKSEIAKRVSYMNANFVQQVMREWLYDAEPSITNWGPIGCLTDIGSYNHFKKNTIPSVTNMHHTLKNFNLDRSISSLF